ncbi:hypothetical protein FA95DRAFT_1154396 [Auriscalpium vulgare]|uniref:Uncharacterized protein n=1 Tax=Auriscalpium vulgare TaxID=40419 RepID=A0ACB8RVE2_9AGAM|nr:hypothetical protein FA95DRAFT_1154396 [Auriscalpium vulgare]
MNFTDHFCVISGDKLGACFRIVPCDTPHWKAPRTPLSPRQPNSPHEKHTPRSHTDTKSSARVPAAAPHLPNPGPVTATAQRPAASQHPREKSLPLPPADSKRATSSSPVSLAAPLVPTPSAVKAPTQHVPHMAPAQAPSPRSTAPRSHTCTTRTTTVRPVSLAPPLVPAAASVANVPAQHYSYVPSPVIPRARDTARASHSAGKQPQSHGKPSAPHRPTRTVSFRHGYLPYHEFSNYSPHRVIYQVYQAMKFLPTNAEISETIRKMSSPLDAANEATRQKEYVRGDWPKIRLSVLDEILKLKFTQNTGLESILTSTGDAHLLTLCPNTFWGVGKDNSGGDNELGKALMRVRKTLQRVPPEPTAFRRSSKRVKI